ncbi:MAG: CusA/CzcA family heavy metal efflux RND transporter [Deltaproteobacteria bacterium HGW-Deltaproteobacteria-14]|jgi:cobalt-zinc-cadmium resistance protein CzcA|nr:MAG: CusA/CzcA family heavy metal efflux RND transporter [Deltaproteobacteria bacterium HGW-Deltaproteobacteria-14]
MAAALVAWSLRNRFLVLVLSLLAIAVGVEHMLRLPIDAVPDVTNVQVQVLTTAPALAPAEVERLITVPVEAAMAGLPDVEEIRSVSKFGLSSATVVFEEGTDIYRARQLVQERLVAAREAIPEGYGVPEMGPITTGLGEIYQFEVRGEPLCPADGPDTEACYTPMELRTLLDWFVAYQLKTVPGVVEVNTFGGELKTYEVAPDPAALRAHHLPISDLFAALERNNRNVGGAYLVKNREQVVIRGEGLVQTLQDIGDVVLRAGDNGRPLYVRDVADVRFAPMVRQGVVTRDGRGEAVVGIVMMLMGENPRDVVDRVEDKLAAVRTSLPPGVTIEVFYDRTDLVDHTIATVETNLLEGGLLVVAVLLLMLGNLRGGLIVASAIPLSMLLAFIGMVQADVSGNLMSLGAIDFGLIVDGAVVMIENVFRLMAEKRDAGVRSVDVVREATTEVARPVAFAVGIIILVYVPILTLGGIEGKMFRPMAWTVIFALAGSLVLALTLVPVLASLFVRRPPKHHETLLVRGLRRLYRPALDGALRRRGLTIGAAALIFAGGVALATTLGAEFIPKLDEGALALEVRRLPSVSVEEAAAQSAVLERALLEAFPDEVATVISKTGRPEIATDPMGVDASDVMVMLRPRERWRQPSKLALIEAMERVIEERVPGVGVGFSQPIELRVAELIAGVRSDVAVEIYGDDLETLRQLGGRVAAAVAEVPGAVDVKLEQVAGLPVMTAHVDRRAVARHGVNADDVLDVIEALGGHQVGVVLEGERRFALQVRFPESARADEEVIARLPVTTADGRTIPLGELVTFDTEPAPSQISRSSIQRRITVELNVRGRDIASVVADARVAVDAVALPPRYVVAWGGQFENLERASARLLIVVPLALLLIFVLLYGTFDAARPALLIFLNVPFAAVGGVVALALRGMPFSISAGVGFIALFGVAVMNGVVLVSYCRKLEREGGVSPAVAAREAALVRMRPVLTTALVAALGFIPMALSTSAGAEVQRPLATVVIGGLITATLLTLFVLPTLYGWVRSPRRATARTSAGR